MSDQTDREKYGLPRFITLANGRVVDTRKGTVVEKATVQCQYCGQKESVIDGLRKAKHPAPLMPYALQCLCPYCKEDGRIYDGRSFISPGRKDITKVFAAYREWESQKSTSLEEFSPENREIPFGWQTHYWSIPDHGYTHWYRMFNPRQLLTHANLLRSIMTTDGIKASVRDNHGDLSAISKEPVHVLHL